MSSSGGRPTNGSRVAGGEPVKRSRSGSRSNGSFGSEYVDGGAEDPVHTYLKEIGKVPLLNAELEVELGRRIHTGVEAAARLAAHAQAEEAGGPAESILSPAGLRGDGRTAEVGEQAKEALIEANLRLVVSIAKRYRNRGLATLNSRSGTAPSTVSRRATGSARARSAGSVPAGRAATRRSTS